MKGERVMLLVLSFLMISVCIGVGFAEDYYSGSTSHTDDIKMTYITMDMANQDNPYEVPFHFENITYYRDRIIDGNGTTGYTDTYRSHSKESDVVKFIIVSTETDDPPVASLKIRIAEMSDIETITIQFFSDPSCQESTKITNPITLAVGTDKNVTPLNTDSLNTNTDYYCKATMTLKLPETAGDQTNEASFTLVFTATAAS